MDSSQNPNMQPNLFNNSKMQWAALAVLVLLALFLLAQTINAFKETRYIGADIPPVKSITVNGTGEAFAIPDIATFTYAVTEEAATVAEAQEKATEKGNRALEMIRAGGVEDKDIKTIAYTVSPRYEFTRQVCNNFGCTPGERVLKGFEVSQTVQVKVRDTAKAGALLSQIGELGVQNVSGLSFTIDDEESVKLAARTQAIERAEAKAKLLAEQLNIKLGRVVSFYEDFGPIYPYDAARAESFGMGGDGPVRIAPDLPIGENKVMVNVNITYEIR